MGLAISIQIIQPSQLYLAKTLWLLAGFGFTHAISEWGYIFVPIQTNGHEDRLIILMMIHLAFMALSFAFLFAFGLSQFFRDARIYLLIPAGIFLVWYVNFVLYFGQDPLNVWYIKSEIWARYLLGFPGAMVAGLGFWRRRRELKVWGNKISLYARNAAITLLLYSVLGGLIVPAGDVFLSHFVNNELFSRIFHIPVQVARATLSILLSWFVLRILSIFRLEYLNNMEKIERLETLFQERQRIANDIHDGAIQTIYGSGMLLDRASELINSNPERSKEEIEKAILRLNETIDSLRRYIHGLKSEDFGQTSVEDKMRQTVQQYREAFPALLIEDDIRVPIWIILMPGVIDHVIFIVQEALANAARHSECTQIILKMNGDDHCFRVTIVDNGKGIDVPIEALTQSSAASFYGHGIKSMQQRANILKTKLQITSDERGTQVGLMIERWHFNVKNVQGFAR